MSFLRLQKTEVSIDIHNLSLWSAMLDKCWAASGFLHQRENLVLHVEHFQNVP